MYQTKLPSLILLAILLITSHFAPADCFDPCGDHPAPGNTCAEAVPMRFDVPICASSVGYTADHWGNLEEVFCGGLHNNSFFEFIAEQPDIDIPWWVLSGSFCDRGLQFQVLTTVEPCDNPNGTWQSVYCLSPTGPPGSNGIIPLRDLTVGQRYYFMIDGFAGDLCEYQLNFQVPYDEIFNFTGTSLDSRVELLWVVDEAYSFESYRVSRSRDGESDWQTIDELAPEEDNLYRYSDLDPMDGFNYYRLELVDENGNALCSKHIRIYFGNLGFQILSLFPNPSKDIIYIEYSSAERIPNTLEIFDSAGRLLHESGIFPQEQIERFFIDISPFPAGAYILNLYNRNGKTTRKFIKAY